MCTPGLHISSCVAFDIVDVPQQHDSPPKTEPLTTPIN